MSILVVDAFVRMRSTICERIIFRIRQNTAGSLADIPASARGSLAGNERALFGMGNDGENDIFIALDFESLEKKAMVQDEAIYMKFVADVIKPHTVSSLTLDYEMEPGKSVKYS